MPKASSLSPPTSPASIPAGDSQVLAGITIHVIDSKLNPTEVGELFALAQSTGAKLSSTPQNASVLVTALTMRRRLERHISWDIANTKNIVSPQWLRDCAKQDKLLPFSEFKTIQTDAGRRVSLPQSGPSLSQVVRFSTSSSISEPSRSKATIPEGNHNHPLATHRHSPLVCPNQALCEELAVIMRSRFLEGEVNNELSYSRAIAVLKAYPKIITSADEIKGLPWIGPKTYKLIGEFISKGKISDARKIASSERFQVLSELTEVHGIGPTKAREHYAVGHKSVQDLIKFYEANQKGVQTAGVLAAARLKDELSAKIPRLEVESIAQSVYNELNVVQKGCEYTICGGHRRGKPFSNDIDIVFTHQKDGLERHLCTRLVDRLREAGMVTHVLNKSSYTSNHENTHGRQKETRACMDVLDKALVILKPPNSTHRRVDLIFAPYTVYWTAILGWTGSKQFERDLRIHAKQRGLKFDSGGITRQRDSKPIIAYSEQEVFKALELEYIEPELRNADI